jgi:hypothetical protein
MSSPPQLDLFAARPPIRVDHRISQAERPRLSRQSMAILERLERGPATNAELAEISIKYGARLSDCRKAGYVITLVEYDRKTGRGVYQLGESAGVHSQGRSDI